MGNTNKNTPRDYLTNYRVARKDLTRVALQGKPRYIESNAVRARLVSKAEKWRWSSARAHALGVDREGFLCFDRWRHVFGNPSTIVEDWRDFVEGPLEEARANAARVRRMATGSAHNRPSGWAGVTSVLRVGSPPG